MRLAVERGLVALALRRTLGLGACVWTAALATAVALTLPAATAPVDAADVDVAAGLARQSVWTAFLLGVGPLLVLRSTSQVAPWRRHDASWLATRAVSNTTIAVSTWLGACSAGVALAVIFGCLAELRRASITAPPVLRGSFELPRERRLTETTTLIWSATLDDSVRRSNAHARIELGLGPGAGAACAVSLRVRGHVHGEESTAIDRIGNRGTIEVRLPADEVSFEFELTSAPGEARVFVLSERGEVWSRDGHRHAASLAMFARLALALSVWVALALAFSCFVSGRTAACGVLALWTPLWFSSGIPATGIARIWPGADLFDALAIVGEGRAPAAVGLEVVCAAIAIVTLSLGVCAIALRGWRVSR